MTQTRFRSALFAPANKLELLQKLPRTQPDIAVLDLEDAVPDSPAAKAEARAVLQEAAPWFMQQAQQVAYVRVNPVHSPYFEDDVAALSGAWQGVVLPKVEEARDLSHLQRVLEELGLGHLGIMAGIETVAGVEHLPQILAGEIKPSCLYFGAEDYTTDLGGERTESGLEVLYPRSRVAAVARLAGVPALDIVCTKLRDDAAFNEEATFGRALGYGGKLCIHPAQVPLAHTVFSPTPEAVARARELLRAAGANAEAGSGVFAWQGQMVDGPMLTKARAVLAAAGESL